MEINEYLHTLIRQCEYPITISGNKPNFLTRWLVKVEPADEKPFTVEPFLKQGGRITSTAELKSLPEQETSQHWRYYESSCVPYYHNICNVPETLFPGRDDLYIYCVANIYSKSKELVLLNIGSKRPVRLWVNGQLGFTSSYFNHISPYLFLVELQPGNNPVLLEKMKFSKSRLTPPDAQHTTITLKPVREIKHNQENYPFYDTSLLREYQTGFTLIPTKAFYGPDEEIQLTALRKKINGQSHADIKISISNLRTQTTHTMMLTTGNGVSFDHRDDYSGLLRIGATMSGYPRNHTYIYVYRGNWKADILNCIKILESQGAGEEIITSARHILNVPDCDKGYVSGSFETLEDRLTQYLLEKTHQLYDFIAANPRPQSKMGIRSVFHNDFPLIKNLPNNGSIAYTVFLPLNYRPDKKYPLVIEMEWPYGKSFPRVPDFVAEHRFHDAIIICMRGIFNDCNDFIYEFHTLQMINNTVSQYSIDRNRIYFMGICGGASKVFYMVLRMPDICTGILAITGSILASQGELKNIENVIVYQLSNIEEDEAQYGRFVDFLPYFPRIRHWSFYDLLHTEMNEVHKFSNRIFRRILKERRAHFPKCIHFIVIEPCYNKCHWVIVQSLTDLNRRGLVYAQIKKGKVMAITTENIENLRILTSLPDMGLSRCITLRVNNLEQKLQLPPYADLEISIQAESISVKICSLSKAAFFDAYQKIGIDPKKLGLKEIYLESCILVKPDYLDIETHKSFAENLFYKLKQPVKNPVNDDMNYPMVMESQITPVQLAETNFIYVLDAGEIDIRQAEMLQKAGIVFEGRVLHFRNEIFAGEYFALIKTANPYHECRNALWVIYHGGAMENALLHFLDVVFVNKYVYSDALIYHGEALHGIRYDGEIA